MGTNRRAISNRTIYAAPPLWSNAAKPVRTPRPGREIHLGRGIPVSQKSQNKRKNMLKNLRIRIADLFAPVDYIVVSRECVGEESPTPDRSLTTLASFDDETAPLVMAIVGAEGGLVIEARWYEQRSDTWKKKLHIVNREDSELHLGDSLRNIVLLHSLGA